MYNDGKSVAGQANAVHREMAAPGAAVEVSQTELLINRLLSLRDHYSSNTRRVIELGSRAFGGTSVGNNKTAGSDRPEAAGALAAVGRILEELEAIAILQSDAVSFAERIV